MLIRLESSYNTKFLAKALSDSKLLATLQPNVVDGGYHQLKENALNPDSTLYQDPKPDVLVIALNEAFFPSLSDLARPLRTSQKTLEKKLAQEVALLEEILDTIQERHPSIPLFVTNLAVPTLTHLGLMERNLSELSIGHVYHWLNQQIEHLCHGQPQRFVCDVETLARHHGVSRFFDARLAYAAQSPYSQLGIDAIANQLARCLLTQLTPPKKVIAVDLDNTLWGGILGEDGIDGIQLDPHGVGGAYYDFQTALKSLQDQGLLLVAVSKNNEADVKACFAKHPHQLLKESDFVAMRINWNDKARNLNEIAAELNLGLESFVFIDDNPMEREWVEKQLPMVDVIALPKDPSDYAPTLLQTASLWTLSLSQEDHQRSEKYAVEKQRKQHRAQFDSFDSYLHSLEMKMTVAPIESSHFARATQLIQRTNQFNLTTRRYTEAEVQDKLLDSERYHLLGLWLEDRFGPYGMIGLCILKRVKLSAHIDTFLLSCRALGRKVETAFIHSVINYGKTLGCTQLTAEYRPTFKNEQAAPFFDNHGFRCLRTDTDGNKTYTKEIETIEIPSFVQLRSDHGTAPRAR